MYQVLQVCTNFSFSLIDNFLSRSVVKGVGYVCIEAVCTIQCILDMFLLDKKNRLIHSTRVMNPYWSISILRKNRGSRILM